MIKTSGITPEGHAYTRISYPAYAPIKLEARTTIFHEHALCEVKACNRWIEKHSSYIDRLLRRHKD